MCAQLQKILSLMLCVKEYTKQQEISEGQNIWGHIAKYMGTYCQTYWDMLPIQNICTTYMGTGCQYKIYVQHIWGQIANAKEYIWNIIDYHAWHESRSTLHFRQQPRQSFV